MTRQGITTCAITRCLRHWLNGSQKESLDSVPEDAYQRELNKENTRQRSGRSSDAGDDLSVSS